MLQAPWELLLGHPASRATGLVLLMLLCFIFFFLTVPLDANCYRKYWTDLHRIFRICTHYWWAWSDILIAVTKERCYGNRFLAPIGENWLTPPLFCALAFHNGCENRNKDSLVNTADDPSASVKNFVYFGPVSPEFCRRVFIGRATRWAFSFNHIRQMEPIVDVDAKSFVTAAAAARRAGSCWAVPRI